jgi:Secretion system C-terminal sorting domain
LGGCETGLLKTTTINGMMDQKTSKLSFFNAKQSSLVLLFGVLTMATAFAQPFSCTSGGACPADIGVASNTTVTYPLTSPAATQTCSNFDHAAANGGCSNFNFNNLPYNAANPTCPVKICFTPGQGCGTGNNLCVYTVSAGVCTLIPVDAKGNVCVDVFSTTYSLTICRPGNGPASLNNMTITPCCTPSVTCPVLSPASVSCNAIPAAATTVAQFLALGGGAAITDCGQAVTITFTDVRSSTLVCTQTLTRTYTVRIGTNPPVMCPIVYPIQDLIPPVLTGTPNLGSIGCNTALPTATESVYTATDVCSGVVIPTVSAWSGNPTTCSTVFTRTWTATDICGNTATAVQTITKAKSAGTITFAGTLDLGTLPNCNAPFPTTAASNLMASNACGTYAATATAWTPTTTANCLVTYQRTWTANDGCGTSNTAIQTIKRIEDIVPPVLTGTPTLSNIGCNTALPTANQSVYTASDLCSGTLTPTVSAWTAGTTTTCSIVYTRIWTATDACNNTSTAIQTITKAKSAGTITFAGNLNLGTLPNCDAPFPTNAASNLTASNACGTYTATATAWTATNTTNCLVTYQRTWSANDGCGTSNTAVQTIKRIEDKVPPVLTGTPTLSNIGCNTALPTANQSVYTASDLCSGTLTPTVSVWTAGTTTTCSIVYTRIWTATDACNNTSTAIQTITKAKSAGTITFAGNLDLGTLAGCDAPFPTNAASNLTASNACGTYTATATAWTATNTTNCLVTYQRTWTANDGCGTSNTAVQTIKRIEDKVPPVLTGTANLGNISCTATLPSKTQSTYSASDACTAAVTLTVSDWAAGTPTTCAIPYKRIWIATDACGNSATSVQSITQGKSAGIIAFAGTLDLGTLKGCNKALPTATESLLTASNACGDYVPMVTDWKATNTTNCLVTYTRTWSANDGCGTSNTAVQTIQRIEDTEAPTLIGKANLGTLSGCDNALPTATQFAYKATDACSPEVAPTVTNWVQKHSTVAATTYTRTWTAIDACGNSKTAVQTVTIAKCCVAPQYSKDGYASSNTISLQWIPSQDVSNCKICYKVEWKSKNEAWSTAKNTLVYTTSQVISNLSPATDYDVRLFVKCCNGDLIPAMVSSKDGDYVPNNGNGLCFRTTSGLCNATQYEPNNNPEQASLIASNATLFSMLDNGNDQDWYRFKLSGTKASVTLSNLAVGVDYKVELFDASKRAVKATTEFVQPCGKLYSADQILTFIGTRQKDYYVKVSSTNGFSKDQCYGLSLQEGGKSYGKEIDNQLITNHVELFPNPVHDQLNLDLGDILTTTAVQINISDATGKIVMTVQKTLEIGDNGLTLNVNDLKNGLHFITIRLNEGALMTRKILVAHEK